MVTLELYSLYPAVLWYPLIVGIVVWGLVKFINPVG